MSVLGGLDLRCRELPFQLGDASATGPGRSQADTQRPAPQACAGTVDSATILARFPASSVSLLDDLSGLRLRPHFLGGADQHPDAPAVLRQVYSRPAQQSSFLQYERRSATAARTAAKAIASYRRRTIGMEHRPSSSRARHVPDPSAASSADDAFTSASRLPESLLAVIEVCPLAAIRNCPEAASLVTERDWRPVRDRFR
jgi:hypothetical protein